LLSQELNRIPKPVICQGQHFPVEFERKGSHRLSDEPKPRFRTLASSDCKRGASARRSRFATAPVLFITCRQPVDGSRSRSTLFAHRQSILSTWALDRTAAFRNFGAPFARRTGTASAPLHWSAGASPCAISTLCPLHSRPLRSNCSRSDLDRLALASIRNRTKLWRSRLGSNRPLSPPVLAENPEQAKPGRTTGAVPVLSKRPVQQLVP